MTAANPETGGPRVVLSIGQEATVKVARQALADLETASCSSDPARQVLYLRIALGHVLGVVDELTGTEVDR